MDYSILISLLIIAISIFVGRAIIEIEQIKNNE